MLKSVSSPVVSHKPPAVGKGGVSSARERRRRNKQEGGRGRVVLKSRSAADLCKREDKKRDEVDFATPPGSRREVKEPAPPKKESSSDKDEREPNSVAKTDQPALRVLLDSAGGNDEPDSGPTPPQTSLQQQLNKKKKAHNIDVITSSGKDPINSQQPRYQPPPVSVGQKLPRARRVKSDSDSGVKLVGDGAAAAGGPAVLNGQSSDEVEVEEFFTLLDTTLHLPEDSPVFPVPFDGGDHPGPPLTAFSVVSPEREEEEGHYHQRTLPPGRLADRIKALRE